MGEVIQFRTKEKPTLRASDVAARNESPTDPDLAERITRIRTSILRINQLMRELREMETAKPNGVKDK